MQALTTKGGHSFGTSSDVLAQQIAHAEARQRPTIAIPE